MIPKIYIGGTGSTNPYKNINDILSHLGIKSEAYISHHTHFHVYFTPPDAKSFGKALSTEDTTADGMLPPNSEATNLNASKIQSLIDEIGALMDALPQNYSASDSVYRTIPAGGAGVVTPSRIQTWDMDCQEVGAGAVYTDSAYNNIPAAWLVLDSLGYKRDAKTGSFPDSVVSAAILGTTVVTAPKHGRLMEQGQAGIGLSFQFSADSSYQGMDQFALRVDARDKTGKAVSYLLNYKVAVVEGITNEQLPSACERWMKQSRKSASISFPAITELGPLPDARLAETYGLGIDARIVLNDSSAINWHLDPTPLDNTDDFLPTADKTIWRAKAGGAADGKMDLLSVLLHEYGHVLGLDHAGDSSDFMAATLQPGERRLPTQAELAWMAQRIVELKVASGSESGGNDPSNPTAPTQPGLPVGGRTVSSSRAARRSTGDGSAAPQFATGVNVSLLNGSFGQSGTPNGAGWTTQGDVSFTSDGATLGESGGRQARLLQGFAVGANDRLLSFTLAGPGLQANAGGPGDAFEVALLDADTGLPLAGHVDLDGSDALLNRQTARNGQAAVERLASSVRKQINADGSVTYLVMLAPELTGKSVLLSFDLLGFAAADSHVVVRDVHTLADTTPNQAPTAADGQASDVEDAALVLSWTSFAIIDPDSRPDLLQVEITALPVDGELQRQQADGSWAAVAVGERFSEADLAARGLRFVPAANASGGAGYFATGEGNRHEHYARIGFKAFDGELYSPAASLVIDIAAVADAPTLTITGGGTVTGLEDAALALHAIVTGLVDNDGSETLVLTLTGLPDGFTLTDGAHSFTPSAPQRVVNLAGWQLDALQLTPPRDFNGSVALQLQATAIEGATGEYATTSQLLIAQFVAVADAPTLTLSARDIAVSRELLATSWETPANDPATAENPLKSSTAVAGPTLEGWTVLPAVSGKQAAFEILAANDRTVNYGGNALRAQSMPGNGSQWLTLRNGRATLAYQTLGIERTVDTIDGAVYTLGFDYAGGPGFAVANTAIGIYVDGVKVGGYAGTSPTTALNWESLSFTFTGNGQMRRVAIVLEGGDAIAGGAVPQRSANIDDIHLVETLPVGTALLYGLADTAIALPKVAAEPTDSFGSEALALTLGGLPTGAVLSDGVHTAAGGTSVELAGWDLTHLSATPPTGFTGDMSLTVRAASVETGNGASSSVSQAFVVRVLPGTPVATPAGINPFVVTTAAAQATQSQAGSQSVAPPSAAALDLLASARGQMGSAAEPAPLPKTAAEIAQAETDRARSLSDAWLKDLEERAKAQWQQLVGGK
ncbi:matrixin family metalloprotease [Pelomonas sp. P7]|uniref:Matrixin family metalloprotease n=1 Tax=Pelomonas caseinilytica TaxID=2906763 RepID=A0ABS8XQ58_9BURK|nr:matrixin family metalloprotease [Pelomonas sp. P7]MCE4540794.1 matrixin family metalloprotease [Pelomonas sp. P7]